MSFTENANGLIITVGTTAEPLFKAVEEAANEDITFVYIIYGRPFPNQSPNPFDIANEVKKKASSLKLKVQTFEVSDPENFNSCLLTTVQAVKQINIDQINKLTVNFTGGTKPMSGALVHGVLTEPINAEVVLDYTGGVERNDAGRVVGEMRIKRQYETRVEIIARDALNMIKACNYSQAFSITRSFPDSGRFGFLKKSIEALYLWDNFNYQNSSKILKVLAQQIEVLLDTPLLKDIIRIIKKLVDPSLSISKVIDKILKIQNGSEPKLALKGINADELFLIAIDTLENAKRRFNEGKYTDAVLRAYRAIECAIQMRLTLLNINPWSFNPEYAEEDKRECINKIFNGYKPPIKITFHNGIELLKCHGKRLTNEDEKYLQDIQQTRNNSYLEHGYQRVERSHADNILNYTTQIIESLLKEDSQVDITKLQNKIKVDL